MAGPLIPLTPEERAMSAPEPLYARPPVIGVAVILALAALVALAVFLPGSDFKDRRGRGDAPVADRQGDDAPANVINMPDRFSNVAFKCWGANGIYVTTDAVPPVVIADDPECRSSDAPR
jgi:hypothetical protein